MPRGCAGGVWGLALGGGAVRGHAHVGLHSVFEDADLDPDVITGTSAGALVAALWAFGLSSTEIGAALERLNWRSVSHLSARRGAVFSNRELGDICEEILGPVDLTESGRPLAVVAADISTGERVVLREGPVGMAVRASAAIPGIFQPVEIDGRFLVDGAIVENVPVLAARELGAEVVVGVSLDRGLDFTRPRGLMEVIVNAFEIAVATASSAQLAYPADVIVRPDLARFNRWNTRSSEAIQSEGARAARAALPDIERAVSGRSALSTRP